MRSRLALLAACVLVFLGLNTAPAAALAVARGVVVVQENPGEDEGGEQGDQGGGGAGQDDPEAETGADEGESEEAGQEAGPPWTYQMARISIILLVALILATGYLYWRLVVVRRRGEA